MLRNLKVGGRKIGQVQLQQEKFNIKIMYKMSVTYKMLPFFVLLRRIVVLALVVIFLDLQMFIPAIGFLLRLFVSH